MTKRGEDEFVVGFNTIVFFVFFFYLWCISNELVAVVQPTEELVHVLLPWKRLAFLHAVRG